MRYLKFCFQGSTPVKEKHSLRENLFGKILSYILPKANPDFDNKIDLAVYWLLEFDDQDTEDADFPIREIGLDRSYKSILKMPYKKNYGFWTDSSLTYYYFIEEFKAETIEKVFFDKKWDEYT